MTQCAKLYIVIHFNVERKSAVEEQVVLKYGEGSILLNLEGAKSVQTLCENPMKKLEDVEAEFLRGITTGVIGTKPLRELVGPEDPITILISDMTRFWMRQDILCTLLVRYLHEEVGIPFAQMVIVVALGTHRGNSEEELRKLAGEYAYTHVRVLDHDCDAPDQVYIGTTQMGTEVWLNPLAVDRKVICISGTVHHIMAGYGGGRKSIIPGIASRETIRQNHQRALDPDRPMTALTVGSGLVPGNPIHEDMHQAAALSHVVFGISVVVNTASEHSGLFCGDFDQAWLESCRYVQKSYGLPIEEEADVVIASCGGFPKDINLYQSTKTLFNAAQAVKPGGTLILLAECREGGGAKDFFDWNTPLQEGRLDEALRKDFTIGGYIFYAACESIRRSNTLLLSEIDPELVRDMGIRAFRRPEELLSQVDFSGKSVYVIPSGGSVMPQRKDRYDRLCRNLL